MGRTLGGGRSYYLKMAPVYILICHWTNVAVFDQIQDQAVGTFDNEPQAKDTEKPPC